MLLMFLVKGFIYSCRVFIYFTLGVPGFADCLKKQHCFRKIIKHVTENLCSGEKKIAI